MKLLGSGLCEQPVCLLTPINRRSTPLDVSRSRHVCLNTGPQKRRVLSSVSLKATESFTSQPPRGLAVSLPNLDPGSALAQAAPAGGCQQHYRKAPWRPAAPHIHTMGSAGTPCCLEIPVFPAFFFFFFDPDAFKLSLLSLNFQFFNAPIISSFQLLKPLAGSSSLHASPA